MQFSVEWNRADEWWTLPCKLEKGEKAKKAWWPWRDLEMFGRALRLRWLWYEWGDPERPWAGTILPCNATDRQLFKASTIVQLRDGRKAKFWHSPWLEGKAPIGIAPNLHKLAWRNNQTVRDDLQDGNWMHGLWRMQDADTIAEFINLWHKVQQVQLNAQPNSITWRWTTSGQYTAKSAYLIQCLREPISHTTNTYMQTLNSKTRHTCCRTPLRDFQKQFEPSDVTQTPRVCINLCRGADAPIYRERNSSSRTK